MKQIFYHWTNKKLRKDPSESESISMSWLILQKYDQTCCCLLISWDFQDYWSGSGYKIWGKSGSLEEKRKENQTGEFHMQTLSYIIKTDLLFSN